MNNTKWTELISSIIQEMPFPPAFVIKYLTSETKPSIDMMACHYYGDWTGENFPSVESVSYTHLHIDTRHKSHQKCKTYRK